MTDQRLKERTLTKNEQFCLAMRVPKTGDAELDAIIREGNRLEFAKAAMQGILSSIGQVMMSPVEITIIAQSALCNADALLAENEIKKVHEIP